jgi:hypothetical protein
MRISHSITVGNIPIPKQSLQKPSEERKREDTFKSSNDSLCMYVCVCVCVCVYSYAIDDGSDDEWWEHGEGGRCDDAHKQHTHTQSVRRSGGEHAAEEGPRERRRCHVIHTTRERSRPPLPTASSSSSTSASSSHLNVERGK